MLDGDIVVRVLRAALLLSVLSWQVAACGRMEADKAPDTGRRSEGTGFLFAAISNPWTASPSSSAQYLPPGMLSQEHAAPADTAPMRSRDPVARLAALEAWTRSRPDSLHEIGLMLHDPDPSVRSRARELWTAALSGGRKADPD
ncbi:hypothetical protein [Noviherbaspirillum aridicola]|uniref:HEAT repeat domain-containing protein n=1 Tax=Noviherbaspirillum aridicola TaxID=2849687 RepID=A0ABQ4PZZ9_9BURK|nr:hypothetical protein [Noviherbaspirillum aridicola]GIZ50080.1 hypothetical protein NCCP691_00940 [Noviherbaspirillum aridicola]